MADRYQVEEGAARLEELPEQDGRVTTAAKSTKAVAEGVTEHVRAEATAEIKRRVRAPAELGANASDAWVAAVSDAGASLAKDGTRPSLAESLPALAAVEHERGERAKLRVPEKRAAQSKWDEEHDGFREARRLDGNRARSPAPLQAKVARAKALEIGLLAVEALIMTSNALVATGVFEQPRVAWLSPSTWGPGLGIAVGGVLITAVVAHLLSAFIRRSEGADADGRRSRFLLRAGLGLLGVVILATVFGNAAIRVGAVAPDPHVASVSTTAGMVVLSVLAVVAAIAALTGLRVNRLRDEAVLEVVAREYEDDQATERELEENAREAERELSELEREASRFARLEAAFEADVATAAAIYVEYRHRALERVARAVDAFEFLEGLPPAVRSAVCRQVSARRGRGASGMGAAFGLGLAVLVAMTGSACTSSAPPLSAVVVCDATSPHAQSRCDRRLLDVALRSWSAASGVAPGSRFAVVVPSDSYATAQEIDVATMPERFLGDARSARQAWLDAARDRILTMTLPDANAHGRDNRSDLTSALEVAEHFAKSLPGQRTVLLVATDGLVVDDVANFERRVPEPAQFFDALAKEDSLPSLTFDAVGVCGLRNQGISAAAADRRDQIWKRLLSSRGHTARVIPEGCASIRSDSIDALIDAASAGKAE